MTSAIDQKASRERDRDNSDAATLGVLPRPALNSPTAARSAVDRRKRRVAKERASASPRGDRENHQHRSE